MLKNKILCFVSVVLLLNFSAVVFAATNGIKVNGNVVLNNGGTIIFPDGSSQSTATLQGAQGVQGIQGLPGPAGEVTLASICSAIASTGDTVSFCPGSVPDAISGINQTLTAYKDIFNAKGMTTTSNDLIHLYAVNGYQNMGMDVFQDIADTVSANSGYISNVVVEKIIKSEPIRKTMTVLVSITTANWGNGKLIFDFKFDSIASKWLFSGDQRIADVSAKVNSGIVTLRVFSPKPNLESVYVTGPGIINPIYRSLTTQTPNSEFRYILNYTPVAQSEYVLP